MTMHEMPDCVKITSDPHLRTFHGLNASVVLVFSLEDELRKESPNEELRICTPSHPLPLEIQQ
ncbi:protein LEKR1-like isoform X1, partial [Tachysurus ichikawai]